MMLLTLCIFTFPQASSDEVAIYILENGGAIYSRQAISERLNELKLTRKMAKNWRNNSTGFARGAHGKNEICISLLCAGRRKITVRFD